MSNIDHKKIFDTLIASSNFAQNVDATVIDDLTKNVHFKTLKKGHILFMRDDAAESFFFILSGWVKLFKETLDGTQTIIDIMTRGHMIGETAIFEGNAYPYSAEIVEESTIAVIPLRDLENAIEQHPALALNMLRSMARYRKQQEREIEHLSIQNASQRIGCFVLKLLNTNATGSAHAQLPYDKALVAARLGMQPETFSRALKKLKNDTGIDIKGSSIHIENLDKLIQYSCSACSSEFPCKDT